MTDRDLWDALLVGFLAVCLVALAIALAVWLAVAANAAPRVRVTPAVEWCDGSAPTLEEYLACVRMTAR